MNSAFEESGCGKIALRDGGNADFVDDAQASCKIEASSTFRKEWNKEFPYWTDAGARSGVVEWEIGLGYDAPAPVPIESGTIALVDGHLVVACGNELRLCESQERPILRCNSEILDATAYGSSGLAVLCEMAVMVGERLNGPWVTVPLPTELAGPRFIVTDGVSLGVVTHRGDVWNIAQAPVCIARGVDCFVSADAIRQCDTTGRYAAVNEAKKSLTVLDGHFNCLIQYGFGCFEEDGVTLQLNAPLACAFSNGDLFVADTNNNRVLAFSASFRSIGHYGGYGAAVQFWRPSALAANREVLAVVDSKNGRIVKLSREGRVLGECSREVRRLFNLPRSVTKVSGGGLLVADCHNHRAVEVEVVNGSIVFEADVPWARQAITVGARKMAISGRCEEPIMLGDSGICANIPRLLDAHQLLLSGDDFLLVNTGGNEVSSRIGGESNTIGRAEGVNFCDPHSADMRSDGVLAIADTLNNRLVLIDGSQARCIRTVQTEGGWSLELNGPRVVRWLDRNHLLVVDTGTRSILAVSILGDLVWAVGNEYFSEAVPGMYRWQRSIFHDPRWVEIESCGRLLVSDTGNSRILRLLIPSVQEMTDPSQRYFGS
ncbi:MAG: hypothetical protein V7675_15100 [Hyphomonas sp.]|uniref:hypothetical protein n=1 Tax=Hyphomonas sp. TaxID=87 RepID=UPI003001F6C8